MISRPDNSGTWAAIIEAATFRAGHNTTLVLIGATLLGIAAGLVGVFVMLRRRSLISDAVGHATLPGIATAFIIGNAIGMDGRSMAVLLPGAAIGAATGLLAIQWIVRATRLTEDAAIGAVLSVWFGVGVVLLSVIQTMQVGNQGGLKTFIFGQTAAMSTTDARLMGAVAFASIAVVALLFRRLRVVAFDEAYARSLGVRVGLIDAALMALVVTVCVVGLQAVGLLLIVALLIIPAAAARFWTDRLLPLAALSAAAGGASAFVGSAISASFTRVPAGPAIVLVAGAIFVLGMLLAPSRGLVAGLIRQHSVRTRIQADHAMLHLATVGPMPIEAALPPGLSGLLARGMLQRRGLVRRDERMVALTDAGLAAARLADRRRRLWRLYLIRHADIAASHVDLTADAVEHVVDPAILARLEAEIAAEDALDPPTQWPGRDT
ncbi:MAG: metal ABC transporter permease [Phycisphaeraceae bacterium]|nr:MAG: metal ABC transporter permease [Phycisphaeraceae bacterium]